MVSSFSVNGAHSQGLPLGNLTSQLLVNIYMNEFDQYTKHRLKAKYYIRYADDFVFLSHDKTELEQRLRYIVVFLRDELKLQLHPNKVSIQTFASGVDFLGWVHFADYRVLRTSSKRRMLRRIRESNKDKQTLLSYTGLLSHGNAHKLQEQIRRGEPHNLLLARGAAACNLCLSDVVGERFTDFFKQLGGYLFVFAQVGAAGVVAAAQLLFAKAVG